MPSQLCCLLLPSNPLPWETSVLSVTSHTAPSASPMPCQTDPKAMATPPNYRGQNTSMFKCITHFYGIFPCITFCLFPSLQEAAEEWIDLAWLTPLWLPGLNPLLLPPPLGCQVPNPPQVLDGPLSCWDKRHRIQPPSSMRLPSSAEDGRKRDQQ